MIEMKLDTIYFDYIKNGQKLYETRVYDIKRRNIKLLDKVKFIDKGDKRRTFSAIITELSYFNSFEEAITTVGLKKVMPNAGTIQKAVSIYHSFPHGEGNTFKEGADKYGVLRMKFELI